MIRIYGNGDDQIYVERDGKTAQHDGDDASFVIGDAKGGCVVRIRYGAVCVPVWTIEVSQIDEGIALPWSVRFENEKLTDHSLALVIDCPPGTALEEHADREEAP